MPAAPAGATDDTSIDTTQPAPTLAGGPGVEQADGRDRVEPADRTAGAGRHRRWRGAAGRRLGASLERQADQRQRHQDGHHGRDEASETNPEPSHPRQDRHEEPHET